MSKTVAISSRQQLFRLIQSSTVVVADFYADWCGPCKQIAPVFEQLSSSLSRPNQITFVKINTESQQDCAQEYGVTALPTFIIFKNGEVAEKIRGADGKKLQTVVRELAQFASGFATASSSGGSGGGSSAGEWRTAELPKGYGDVTDQIDIKGLELLNSDNDFGTVRTLFETAKPSALGGKAKEGEVAAKDWVESDTDEQLMLFVPFQSLLKLHTLQLTSLPPSDGDDLPLRPQKIHLYTNRPHILGFDEAEDIPATQTFELKESDWDATGTASIALRFVKFQNVTSLVLFVVDGAGDGEKVRLDRLRLIGETGEKRDQGQLKKITDDE